MTETDVTLARKSKSKNCKWHILTPSSPCDSVIHKIKNYRIITQVLHLRDAEKYNSQQFYGAETVITRTIATGEERVKRYDFYIDTSDVCQICISHLRRYEKYLESKVKTTNK